MVPDAFPGDPGPRDGEALLPDVPAMEGRFAGLQASVQAVFIDPEMPTYTGSMDSGNP